MNLNDYRKEMELIDKKIMLLMKERLVISKKIGKYKQANNLPIFVESREKVMFEKYKIIYEDINTWPYYREVLRTILKTSKDIQHE